jgi:acyl carrier protein
MHSPLARQDAPNPTEDRIRGMLHRLAPGLGDGFPASKDLYRELGVKSIVALDLLLSLEEEFTIAIADIDYGEATTLEKLVALIEGLTAKA